MRCASWLAWREPLGDGPSDERGGFTRRANSCHAVGDPGVAIKQAAEQIIGFAVIHDIHPWLKSSKVHLKSAHCNARAG